MPGVLLVNTFMSIETSNVFFIIDGTKEIVCAILNIRHAKKRVKSWQLIRNRSGD